jgi:hypothetical protein
MTVGNLKKAISALIKDEFTVSEAETDGHVRLFRLSAKTTGVKVGVVQIPAAMLAEGYPTDKLTAFLESEVRTARNSARLSPGAQ